MPTLAALKTTTMPSAPPTGSDRLRWPLPAVLAWGLAWGLFILTRPALGGPLAAALALGAGALLAWRQPTALRRVWVAAGFPLSALATGLAGALPAWAWLLPMGVLLLAYPVRAWGDAPVFPTPAGALDGIARRLPLPRGARILDAGCGAGHGLKALHQAWPEARLEGVEWSWPLAVLARWRCPQAQVRRGDMWRAGSWQGLDVVYLFQRPESMQRAWDKACAEMAPGSWLVSLDFAVPDQPPHLCLQPPGARQAVWVYRIPPAAQPGLPSADKPAACPTPLRAV